MTLSQFSHLEIPRPAWLPSHDSDLTLWPETVFFAFREHGTKQGWEGKAGPAQDIIALLTRTLASSCGHSCPKEYSWISIRKWRAQRPKQIGQKITLPVLLWRASCGTSERCAQDFNYCKSHAYALSFLHICGCMSAGIRPENNFWCLPLSLSTLCFENP